MDTTVEKKALRGLHGVLRDAASLYQDLPPEGMVDVLRKVTGILSAASEDSEISCCHQILGKNAGLMNRVKIRQNETKIGIP